MKSLLASIIAVVIVAGLGAAQDQQPPQAFAGQWEVALGAGQPTLFDRTIQLTVDGTKLTGTMTIGSRTVKLVGEIVKGVVWAEPAADSPQADEVVQVIGSFRDGEIVGTYFYRVDGGLVKTGWRARRPA